MTFTPCRQTLRFLRLRGTRPDCNLTQLTRRILSRSNSSGNMHVAFVKKSTPAKMKKRGHVPPRLETVLRRVRYVPPITGSAICE